MRIYDYLYQFSCFSIISLLLFLFFFFFFFNDTATTEIYTLSLHDALPIYRRGQRRLARRLHRGRARGHAGRGDRKSTRLNSSHVEISYAVFCLKKKKRKNKNKQKKLT